MQAYSDPSREFDPYSLPDIEVFYVSYQEFLQADPGTWMYNYMYEDGGLSNVQRASDLKGWYWWCCFPGCLPDGDPVGPFCTEDAALTDAREERE